jgi:hypothetical protein
MHRLYLIIISVYRISIIAFYDNILIYKIVHTHMSKIRISIKLNEYEYATLYRIQSSCIVMGLNYNRAPPLNEIIRSLIAFVYYDITNKNENIDLFFNTIKRNSEYPVNLYHGPIKVPGKSGNYIFIANDGDTEILKKIATITAQGFHENYDFPKIIRYCIHYVLYPEGFLYTRYGDITKKAEFVLIIIMGNLYNIEPKESVELFKNALFNIERLNKKDIALLQKIVMDEGVYNDTIKIFVKEIGLAEAKFNYPLDFIESLDPQKIRQYDSRVSDFNFLDVIFGLGYLTYTYEIDSFDFTMSSVLLWQKEKINKDKLPPGTFIPPRILAPMGPSIRVFISLFNKIIRESKKYL